MKKGKEDEQTLAEIGLVCHIVKITAFGLYSRFSHTDPLFG